MYNGVWYPTTESPHSVILKFLYSHKPETSIYDTLYQVVGSDTEELVVIPVFRGPVDSEEWEWNFVLAFTRYTVVSDVRRHSTRNPFTFAKKLLEVRIPALSGSI